MSHIRIAACALALALSSGLAASADTVKGTALYRERIMPPPDARFVATLSDISLADAPAIELGRIEQTGAGAPPYAFEIEYDAAAINPKHTYALRATLWSGDEMMFTTDTVVPVLTQGAPNEATIIMRRVTQAPTEAADEAVREFGAAPALMGGMMTYMADAATFKECRTGESYPIVQDGDYLALERAYLADQSAPAAPLYVNIVGKFDLSPAMEGPAQMGLKVDKFVRTRAGITCEGQQADAVLERTYWRIDRLAGEDLSALHDDPREPHMIFQSDGDNRFTATVGCNGMIGEYTQQDDTLKFDRVAGTLMACPAPFDTLEPLLAQALTSVRRYQINGGTLALYDEADEIIALLSATQAQ